jgi:hypothetical protein
MLEVKQLPGLVAGDVKACSQTTTLISTMVQEMGKQSQNLAFEREGVRKLFSHYKEPNF